MKRVCYCGAPKQTSGGHRWNTALGCGSEPLNPDTWPPKQPEQTAPEARRWTPGEVSELQKWADHFCNTCQVGHRQIAFSNKDSAEWQECPVCEALAQAKKDRETLERIEAICRFDQKWNQAEWSRERLAIYRALKSES